MRYKTFVMPICMQIYCFGAIYISTDIVVIEYNSPNSNIWRKESETIEYQGLKVEGKVARV